MKPKAPKKRLGDLFAFRNGRAFKKEEWSTVGVPIIRIQNLNNEDAPFNFFAGEYSTDILVEPGDLLFSWSGTVGSSFGSHLWQRENGVLNQHIFKIVLRDTIEKRYAFHGLRHITAEIERSVSGAVGLVHITKEKLNKFTLPVPPLAEQQRIVGILDEAFGGIATAKANAEKNLQNARALFESHLQSVFTDGGSGWTERRLGDVVTRLTNGYVGPTRNIYHESGVPYLLARHVKDNRLLFDGRTFITDEFNQKNKKSMLKVGDVLLVQSGHIGHSAVVTPEHEGHNCHAMIVITSMEGAFIGAFLSLFFNSSGMKRKFQEIRSGSTVPHLTCGEIRELKVALPDLATQQRVVDRSLELERETQHLAAIYERKLAALEALKKSLLHQAFSGQL